MGESKGNALVQQRLKAWQPFLSPTGVIVIFGAISAIFIGAGIAITIVNSSLVEISKTYSAEPSLVNGYMQSKMVDLRITITEDMTGPVYVYYGLSNFYQNHRRYVSSRSDSQLVGASLSTDASDYSSACTPMTSDSGANLLYPCGLVAWSVFNDTFSFFIKDSVSAADSSAVALEMDESPLTIAWRSDVERKFGNIVPSDIASSGSPYSDLMNMWIVSDFPPALCKPTSLSSTSQPVYVRTVEVSGKSYRKADCDYSAKTCSFTLDRSSNEEFTCANGFERIVNPAGWGVENGHFINWMRTAGLPEFRKLYAKIPTSLTKGQVIIVRIEGAFPVDSFGGSKRIIFATTSTLGGKNTFLGYAYLTVGVIAGLFAILFAFRHFTTSRSLEDIRYLD